MKRTVYAIALVCALPILNACSDSATTNTEVVEETPIRVVSVLPDTRDIDYVLTALGSIESISSPTVSAETAGRIIEISADVGTSVESAQVLVRIDDTLHQIQAAEARAELTRLSVMVENQGSEVKRLQKLATSQSVSKDQLEDQQDELRMMTAQREVAQKRWEHASHLSSMAAVRAPHAGAIANRYISLGDYVSPGQPLFDLVATDRLRARLAFPEQDASAIAKGLEVKLLSPAVPGKVAIGHITRVNPRIKVMNRSIEVLVEFDNPGGWYPGGSVDAELVVSRKTDAVTVPRMAVVVRDGRDVVFVASDEGRASARPVTLGWQEPGWIEVTSGLLSSDSIITEGAALLSNGSALDLTEDSQ